MFALKNKRHFLNQYMYIYSFRFSLYLKNLSAKDFIIIGLKFLEEEEGRNGGGAVWGPVDLFPRYG